MCPAEIARRRFMPALVSLGDSFEYAGVGVAALSEFERGPEGSPRPGDEVPDEALDPASLALAEGMRCEWGGEVWRGYGAVLADPSVDAVYLPLPPGLHAAWGRAALLAGKHLLMEKPFTTSLAETECLVSLARERGLAVHENYMFAFHPQLAFALSLIGEGRIGESRLYRVDFGFPRRSKGDFRYVRAMGGGALLDCGGYALKLASMLVGPGARVACASMSPDPESDVDLSGSATVHGPGGTAQVAWSMAADYRCSLDVWGSEGSLSTGRILTAPTGLVPEFTISRNGVREVVRGPEGDSFAESISHFGDLVWNPSLRASREEEILAQARIVEDARMLAEPLSSDQ